MKPNRIAAVVTRQAYLLRGSFSRVLSPFVWILIDMILWGFITRYLNSVSKSGFNFVPTLLGAVLLWDFFARVMLGVTTGFFEDVWSRNFINFFSTPLLISEYLTGLVLWSIATSLIGLTLMLTLTTVLFGLSYLVYGAMLVPFLLILFLFGIALGIVACGIVLRLGPSAEWFIWPIPAILSPFVGVFYPLSTLPHWMQIVAKAIPPSYVFEGMRGIILRQTASWSDLLCGGAVAIIYIGLAFLFFTKIYRRAVHTGLLARYSAESF